jgi:hypothetical protein
MTAIGQVVLRILRFSPAIITPRMLHTDHLNIAIIGRTSGRGLAAFKQRNASQQYVLGYRVSTAERSAVRLALENTNIRIMCQQD